MTLFTLLHSDNKSYSLYCLVKVAKYYCSCVNVKLSKKWKLMALRKLVFDLNKTETIIIFKSSPNTCIESIYIWQK